MQDMLVFIVCKWRVFFQTMLIYFSLNLTDYIYINIYVGAKAQDHTMGLGSRMENSTTSKEKAWVPKGLPAQFLWA